MPMFQGLVSTQASDIPFDVPVLVKLKQYKCPSVLERNHDDDERLEAMHPGIPDTQYGVGFDISDVEWWMGLPA